MSYEELYEWSELISDELTIRAQTLMDRVEGGLPFSVHEVCAVTSASVLAEMLHRELANLVDRQVIALTEDPT